MSANTVRTPSRGQRQQQGPPPHPRRYRSALYATCSHWHVRRTVAADAKKCARCCFAWFLLASLLDCGCGVAGLSTGPRAWFLITSSGLNPTPATRQCATSRMTSTRLCSDQEAQLVTSPECYTATPLLRHHLGPLNLVQPAEVAGRLDPQLVQHLGNPVWVGNAGAHDRSQQLVCFCLGILSWSGEIQSRCSQIRPSNYWIGTMGTQAVNGFNFWGGFSARR
jgi:hypothetical protein